MVGGDPTKKHTSNSTGDPIRLDTSSSQHRASGLKRTGIVKNKVLCTLYFDHEETINITTPHTTFHVVTLYMNYCL